MKAYNHRPKSFKRKLRQWSPSSGCTKCGRRWGVFVNPPYETSLKLHYIVRCFACNGYIKTASEDILRDWGVCHDDVPETHGKWFSIGLTPETKSVVSRMRHAGFTENDIQKIAGS